ncbi:MAG: hypothetical protein QM680_08860 [Luteolibacter sp.]
MRTTIDLPDPIFRAVKTRAAQEGLKLKDLVTSYIEAGLKGTSDVPPVTRKRSPLPIFKKSTGTPNRALSNQELYAILDEEDAARYHQH